MPSPELAWAIDAIARDRARAGVSTERYDPIAARSANPWTDLPVPEGTVETFAVLDGVRCYWVVAPGADPADRIVYLHGGGFCAAGYHSHRALTGWLSHAARAAVLFVEYRLAPEHRFPAQLDDAWAAFRVAAESGPAGAGPARRLFAAGDSAGGALAIAMALKARDDGVRGPDAVASLCGMLDLDERSSAYLKLLQRSRDMVRQCVTWLDDLKNPYYSPVLADFRGLPPLLLQTGTADYCRGDSEAVAERARAAGVAVTLTVWPDMIHVWQRFAPKLPEAGAALGEVAAFLAAAAGERARAA